MRLIGWAAAGLSILIASAGGSAQSASPWSQPAASLAEQIAGILGPGQAHLTIRNASRLPNEAVPAVHKLLEQDLKVRGITLADEESANSIRVTLSESAHERLWVAEVAEGSATQVVMVELGADPERHAASAAALTLRLQTILATRAPVLAALETPSGLIALEPEQLVVYARTAGGFREQGRADLGDRRPLPRDRRGILRPDASGTGFEAWLPGTECLGPDSIGEPSDGWAVSCHASDDPWPVLHDANSPGLKAFYNSSRNYFTGVVTPGIGLDLPPFYSLALAPRAAGGTALIASGIDAKTVIAENGLLRPMAGTRDWGSDFAVIHSDCGDGTQIVASSSGAAATDSLRAYALPGLEAIPVSNPLEVSGTVMALWPAPDGRSVYATVRHAADEYEVDRVSALCN
jgi:hypothetical protein